MVSNKIRPYVYIDKLIRFKFNKEIEVIEGGKFIIKKNKPILLVEIEERHSKKNVYHSIDYINGLGYNSYIYDESHLKKHQN